MGEAEFERDGSLVTVVLDGQPQSAVDLDDPERLDFEYVQHLALCIDALAPDGSLRVTHVGGAGLTLARWVQHTRPGSPQVVLEPDAALTEAVRRELPLPRGHRIRVRPVDGLAGVGGAARRERRRRGLDAYAAGRVPPELATVEWFAEVGRVLAPGGLLLANVADEPGLRYAARVAAGARVALGHVAFVGLHEVLKGKRFGNLVLVGSTAPLDLWTLRRATASAAAADRGAVLGRRRAAPAGSAAVQRGRRRHGLLTGAARAGRLAPPLIPTDLAASADVAARTTSSALEAGQPKLSRPRPGRCGTSAARGSRPPPAPDVHDIWALRATRSGCGIIAVNRPSGVVTAVRPSGEPLGLNG